MRGPRGTAKYVTCLKSKALTQMCTSRTEAFLKCWYPGPTPKSCSALLSFLFGGQSAHRNKSLSRSSRAGTGWLVYLILGFSITHRHKPHSPISALSVVENDMSISIYLIPCLPHQNSYKKSKVVVYPPLWTPPTMPFLSDTLKKNN